MQEAHKFSNNFMSSAQVEAVMSRGINIYPRYFRGPTNRFLSSAFSKALFALDEGGNF